MKLTNTIADAVIVAYTIETIEDVLAVNVELFYGAGLTRRRRWMMLVGGPESG